MTDYETDRLLDAVDMLTKERTVHTTITDDLTGEWLRVHSEVHPPLLVLLMDGTGAGKASPSSNIRIPIDADALELWGQVRDLVKLWCRQLDASFIGDDLLVSIRHWYLAHVNAHRAKRISDVVDSDVTRMVESWVRMIEAKYDPAPKDEFTERCPAHLRIRNIDGDEIGHRRCGARRIVVNGDEKFAITINWKILRAECAQCHSKWDGERGLMLLRYESNLYSQEEIAGHETAMPATA